VRLRTTLRSSSALWAAPVALALPLFYLAAGRGELGTSYGYAPSIVSSTLRPVYPFAYAVASGLAAWESAGLTAARVWELAPVRSRYHVAAQALAPVVGLAWLMFLVPVGVALAHAGTLPTVESLRPLAVALPLSVAHAVIGFGIGRRTKRLISVPVLFLATWVLVAFPVAVEPLWLRHLSGGYPMDLQFGEVATLGSLLPHLMLTGGAALAVALGWLRRGTLGLRVALSAVVAVAGTLGAYAMVNGLGANAPVLSGRAPMTCVGSAPKVCMPTATASDISSVRTNAVAVLDDLRAAGVTPTVEVITDNLGDGRHPRASTAKTMRVPLTRAAAAGKVRFAVLSGSVRIPCAQPDLAKGRAANMWAAEVTGQEAAYRARMNLEPEVSDDDSEASLKRVSAAVDKVRAKSSGEQARWYADMINAACRGTA
jgi:hypothetical protein